MNLLFFCPRWGSESLSWSTFIQKAIDAGYDGIEWGIHSGTETKEAEEAFSIAGKHHLRIILQHWDTASPDFAEHATIYGQWLEKISPYPAYKINSQTGKDYFTVPQNLVLFELADTHSRRTEIAVVHETHRGKSLFAAHVAREYFAKDPQLRITLDISHWVTVAESFLQDQLEVVQMAFDRTDHLHARIGNTQAPQVSDPRLAQWEGAREIFFNWWQQLVAHKRDRNAKELSITTEFGPPPYMPTGLSGKAMSDQWELNVYMLQELKRRFG